MTNSSGKFNIRRRCHRGVAIAIAAATALATPVSGSFGAPAHAQTLSEQEHNADVGFLEIDKDITLRRMVVRNTKPKGTVLFLHGFPETAVRLEGHLAGARRRLRSPRFRLAGLRAFVAADGRQIFVCAKGLRARSVRLHTRRRASTHRSSRSTQPISEPCRRFSWPWKSPASRRTIIVGDFAPFDRPSYMYESLQSLKAGPSTDQARDQLNKNRDDILENAFRRGLPKEAQFDVPRQFKDDMSRAWGHGAITTADAFSHYYAHFTRDQNHFELQSGAAGNPGESRVGREGSLHQEGNGSRTRRKNPAPS